MIGLRFVVVSAPVVFAILAQFSAPHAISQDSEAPQIPQSPQLIPRSQSEREANYQAEHHFILNVRVLDDAGQPVTGLQPSDFTLLDNGREEKIASLREVRGVGAPVPPRVMLLLDGLNDTPHDLRAVDDGIGRFLSNGDGPTELPISLALMTDAKIVIDAATQDRDRLRIELASLMKLAHPNVCEMGVVQSRGWGPTQSSRPGYLNCLNLHFKLSVPMLARLAEDQVNTPGRLILVWFGPGWPNLSDFQFGADTPELKQNFFDFLIEMSDALREGQVTLDAVALTSRLRKLDPHRDRALVGVEAVTSEKQATAASLSLQALAMESGGTVLEGPDDFASKIATCMADAVSYYVLAFDSAVGKTPGEYHSIEVKVDKPGVTARTTRYYYAAP